MRSPSDASPRSEPHSTHVFVTLIGRDGGRNTYRLPGPLALVQTDGTSIAGGANGAASHEITHINALSLSEIAGSFPEVDADAASAAKQAGALLTAVCRGGVRVEALMVVAVHAALLGGANSSSSTSSSASRSPSSGTAPPAEQGAAAAAAAEAEAAERRSLLRAAARLTWGLAGLVFELMHVAAGHWPALGPVERQAVAGAALTQLYGLNRSLALGVLRAYGQLNHERFAEMLDSGLLPAPAKHPARSAGGGTADVAGVAGAAAVPVPVPAPEETCGAATGSAHVGAPRRSDTEEAAAPV